MSCLGLLWFQIENNIFDANIQSNETRIKVYDFRDRVKVLQEKFAENQINVYRAEEEADDAERLAQTAEQVSRTKWYPRNMKHRGEWGKIGHLRGSVKNRQTI